MVETTIDVRGLSCPAPQQMTIKAIRTANPDATIIVLANEAGARDSVIRTARALRLAHRLETTAGEYKIYIFREK